MKKLVIFYSFDGNTRFVARIISQAIDADALELKLVEDKKPKGFMKYFWGGRQVMMKEKPALLPLERNPQDYDLLIIGTPVWAFSYAPALATFFSQEKLQGKKIAVFCCSGGGKGRTLEKMKAQLVGNEFIAETDFIEPTRSKEKNTQKAQEWGRSIANLVG